VAATDAVALDLRTMVPGQIHPRIATERDREVSYALYLPSRFDPAAKWPLLVVFDPRARGEMAAELFREAAERRGWIVASSNDTRSDVADGSGNLRAMNAMFPDLVRRLPVDERRIYVAGMSGGAVLGWVFGHRTGTLAGLVSVGGRPETGFESPPSFALWAAAGREDFNYFPTLELDETAARGERPHRFERFEGPHGWFDDAEAARAVDWLEVLAMRDGARPRDEALVAEIHAADLAGAEALLAAGDVLAGTRRLRAIAETYEGLVDVAALARRARELEKSKEARAAREDEDWGRRYERQVLTRAATIASRLQSDEPAAFPELVRYLNPREIVASASKEGARGDAGRRALASAFTQLDFYTARPFLVGGRYDRARIAYELALELRPDAAVSWYNLACAQARTGAANEAIASLRKAVDLGIRLERPIAEDPDLESLRGRPELAELAARASAPPP
jgi:poly(3-hydroxybutyrate) depolymerase